jgi:DNA primase
MREWFVVRFGTKFPQKLLEESAKGQNSPRSVPVIKPSCIRDLKLRVSLADVVSRVVTLRKAGGSRLKGLCPFHSEKTPSFNVDADKGFFKCFGCGKAGDAITFVRETEGLSFSEAVEELGRRFGVPIEYEAGAGPTQEERSLRQELFDLHEQAADWYHGAFKAADATGAFMRAYWVDQRKFPAELAGEFRIGAAPPDGGGLAARLLQRRYSEAAFRQCGLFFIRDDALLTVGALRPRFRGRLMIPIRDHQGRVVAFTARQTSLTPADDPAHEAKYVNSPETPLFSKGQLLFNLDRARTAVGEGRPFVMVEGQLDALRCWQVGLHTAVAPQGTAITDGQLALLRRYQPEVECFFDSDAAGQKAALRLLPMALKAGMEVRFLRAPGEGKVDPDLLFLEGGLAAYATVRAGALSAMAFACRAVLPEPAAASAEQKSRAAQTILALVAAAESEVTRAGFLAEAAGHLRLPVAALQGDFNRLMARNQRTGALAAPAAAPATGSAPAGTLPPPNPHPGTASSAASGAVAAELDLLRVCLHFEELGRPLCGALPHHWIDQTTTAGTLLNRFLGEFEHGGWPGRDHLDGLLETDAEKALIATLLFDAPAFDDPVKVAQAGVGQLRARTIEPRIREIELALASPPADSKADPISLLKERSDLQRQLRQPVMLAAEG